MKCVHGVRVDKSCHYCLTGNEPSIPFPTDSRPLTGQWRYSNGYLCCGTLRIAKMDIDTNPSTEFETELFEWICKTLNKGNQ
jgi:hypothetical protein